MGSLPVPHLLFIFRRDICFLGAALYFYCCSRIRGNSNPSSLLRVLWCIDISKVSGFVYLLTRRKGPHEAINQTFWTRPIYPVSSHAQLRAIVSILEQVTTPLCCARQVAPFGSHLPLN